MTEGAGGGIFMDIMPRLEQSSLGAVINDLTAKMSKLGQSSGQAFGKDFGTQAASASAKMAASLERDMQSAQRAVEKSMENMITAQNKQVQAAGRVEAAQAKLNETLSKYEAGSSKAIKAQNDLVAAQQGAESAARSMQRALNDQAAATTALSDAQVAQQKHMDEASAASAGLAKGATLAAAAIGTTFVASLGVAIDKAANFQTTQTRLVTSAGEAASNLKLVSDGLLQMAGEVGYSAQELSVGMYTIESAGYHGADGLNVMKAAAQGAKMEGAELKTVADAVSTALTDYHMPASDAATVTSMLVTAVGQGKTTMEEFSGSLHSITPLAASAGVSLADVTGALAEMTSHGMSADQASQNLADTLRHILAPTSYMRDEISQVSEALAKLGVDAPIKTVNDLQDSLGSRGLSGTLETLSQEILSAEGPDGKMLLSAFNSSKDAAANLQEILKQMPPDLQKISQEFEAGQMSSTDYRKAVGALPGNMKDLASGFLSAWDKANGFTNAIKNGSPQAQNYVQSIKAIVGDATGLNTTLMLTGENAAAVTENIKLISGATADAGGNVKGWGDIQSTFNQKLAEFKASIGATAISIGTDLLPAATSIASTLSDVANWLGRNKGALDALLISVGGAVAAFAVFKTASAMWTVINLGIEASTAAMSLFTVSEEGATVGASGLAAALATTGISEVVIGITALVAAVIGLAMGVKYAYDHWGWFHTAVQAVWNVLKAVGEWIASTAVAAWHILEKAIDPIVKVFEAVAHAGLWLWHNVIEPAAEGIGLALRVVGAIVLTVLAVPFVIAFKLIEAAVKFVWNDVIKPTFDLIEGIFHWIIDNVIKPVVDLIVEQIHVWGEIISWLHDNIIQPVFNAIADVWHWIYDTIIHPIVEAIKADIDAWGKIFSWLHDNVIKPVGDKIGTVMDGMKTAFKDVVDWLKTQWDRIVGIVGPPIKFVVDTVYNDAIVPTWNSIAGIFGLGKLDKVNAGNIGGGSSGADSGGASGDYGGGGSNTNFAGGGVWSGPGVLPGYAPGKDSVNAVLSPGEGVAVPELVQAIGPSNFMALNHAYSGGRKPGAGPGFDSGGIFGSIGNVIGDIGNAVTGGALDTAKFIAKMIKDPEGAVRELFSGATDKLSSIPGQASQWLDAAKDIPGKFVDSVVQKAIDWAKSSFGLGGGNEAWVSGAGAEQWAPQIVEALAAEGFPTTADYIRATEGQIMTESGGNPNIVQQIVDVNSGGNEARGLVQVTPSTAASLGLAELGGNIYDPVTNLRLGLRWLKARYGGDLLGTWGHGHGYSGGGIIGYAGGGIISKKTTVAADRTAIDRALNWARSEEGGAYNKDGWLDCSGFASGVYDELIGKPPARAFTTVSDFSAFGFKRGTGGIFEIGVTPKPGQEGHMAMTLDGHNLESGGSHNNIAVDGAAAGAMDAQFSDHWYLPGSLFSPKYTGAGSTPNATSKTSDKLSADAQKWQAKAEKAKTNEQKANDAATKHDQSAASYEQKATDADALAAKTSGTARTKHEQAAAHYRELAQKARDAAQKSRDSAAKYQQAAQDDQAKADAAQSDYNSNQSNSGGTNTNANTKTTTTGDNGVIKPMSLHDFGEKLGGIAADAFTETLGISNTVFADPNKSAIVKIGSALLNAKWGQYNTNSGDQSSTNGGTTTGDNSQPSTDTVEPATTTDEGDSSDDSDYTDSYPSDGLDTPDTGDGTTPDISVYDDGGWLEPGKLAINLGRKPEPVLSPRDSDSFAALTKGLGANSPKAYVVIENQHVNGGDGRQVGRDIYREMLAYQGAGSR